MTRSRIRAAKGVKPQRAAASAATLKPAAKATPAASARRAGKASAAPHAIYVYCVAGADAAPSLDASARGLPGAARPRAVAIAPAVWAIVADVPLAQYGSEPIERGLQDLEWVSMRAGAHEAVVEQAMRVCDAVLPMKLFTLFTSEAGAIGNLRERRAVLARALGRVRGCAEWGVHVRLDEPRAIGAARARQRVRGDDGGGERGAASGASFLLRKKAERDTVRDVRAASGELATKVFKALSRSAEGAIRRDPVDSAVGTRLVLDAAFLVRTDTARAFHAAVSREAARVGDLGYELTVTGPWPAYNFAGGRA